MGEQSLLVHCAEALLERGHRVCGVIARDRRIAEWARAKGIPLVDPKGDLLAALSAEPFDYFFSVTNLSILPEELLAMAGKAAINFHDGPLPRYAGLRVPAWALMNRETTHGVCWHLMQGGVDEGDVLAERRFDVAPRETSFTINTKCYEAGIESFAELLDGLERGSAPRRAQDLGSRLYFGPRRRLDAAGFLDWGRSAEELDAVVRALDFGPTDNPIGCAKIVLGPALDADDLGPRGRGAVLVPTVTEVHPEPLDPSAPSGRVVAIEGGLRVATGSGDLEILRARTLDGRPVDPGARARELGVVVGDVLATPSAAVRARLGAVDEELCRHEAFWRKRLARRAPLELPGISRIDGERSVGRAPLSMRRGGSAPARSVAEVAALVLGFLSRLAERSVFDVGFAAPELRRSVAGAAAIFAEHVPLVVSADGTATLASLAEGVAAELCALRGRGSHGVDLSWRRRDVDGPSPRHKIVLEIGEEHPHSLPDGCDVAWVISPDADEVTALYDRRAVSGAAAASLTRRLGAFCEAWEREPGAALGAVSMLTEEERRRVLVAWNDTYAAVDTGGCVHEAFTRQAARTPDATAVIFEDARLSYRELDARTNQLARHLRSLGVGRDVRVGVAVERSLDMVVAILGVQKAGGAYVPLDPTYPAERLAFMLSDAGAPVVIAGAEVASRLPPHGARTVRIDEAWGVIGALPAEPVASDADGASLAYVIYTSGSTGKPKGVMVEHRNVLNFFAGMDRRVEHDPPGVWLAVTSLSFDISVLELLWTLARGFTVVLYRDRTAEVGAAPVKRRRRALDFSLFYFASDEGEAVADKYRLLLEGARFADRSGFVAVWTPERHFHAFGGLYPNPSVASAALAMITDRVHLRGGSCVLPLHAPTRVVEEWSLVDNLSGGRVGIAFASGWQPNDFVIAPEKFQDRKSIMFRDIEIVRRLWRGESVTMRSPTGKDVEIRTLPRPIQRELPVWITAAGSPETFQEAGRIGANVLTHLLGQTFEEVGQKNELYRKAWRDAGHAGRGTITLMLHTFVGRDEEHVKATVRGPMKGYLKSAVNLVKQAAWTFPTFQQRADAQGRTAADIFEKEELSAEDLDALLDHAFERYYRTSGLFGTPEACAAVVDQLRAVDVDEVGCLMDYGVPSATVLEHMPLLSEVRELANAGVDAGGHSLAEQIVRHGVTHLQCTPSMLGMMLADEETRAALPRLRVVMIGGEAFPLALAADLRRAGVFRILNMYGPTETTIWSSVDEVDPAEGVVTIGRPIANTALYVLDGRRQPVLPGMAGELYIGGAGVVRGYHDRPELTAERFVPDPFSTDASARLYRTGDLVRFGEDGRVHFLGRLDHQVKVRGYRIELGEIEAALTDLPGVREAVVVARDEQGGERRIVGYVTGTAGARLAGAELKAALRGRLPEYMVPAQIAVLPALPLTPNAKVDRGALPAPESLEAATSEDFVAPSSLVQQAIARIWTELLHVERVGLEDNFFDLGGHSLLAVQAHRRIRDDVKAALSLTDLFRFPTIRGLAAFLEGDAGAGADLGKSAQRAEARREAMGRRQELRTRRGPGRGA